MQFSFYKTIIRPIIFKIPPEIAHNISLHYLRHAPKFNLLKKTHKKKSLETIICGIKLRSPIGLAAGYDKNFFSTNGLYNLGFGFVVGGTVTLYPRKGNKKTRLIRIQKSNSIINSLGFPGDGIISVSKNIRKINDLNLKNIFISISGNSIEEICECYNYVKEFSTLVEINISSPNTKNLEYFHQPKNFLILIKKINEIKSCPFFIKMPPLHTQEGINENVLKLIELSYSNGIDGLVTSNTHPIKNKKLSVGKGGLSGKPLFPYTIETIKSISQITNKNLPIIACGGISSAKDVWRSISAGAIAVQIYTSMIYEGLSLPNKLSQDLIKMMKAKNITSVNDIEGEPPNIN